MKSTQKEKYYRLIQFLKMMEVNTAQKMSIYLYSKKKPKIKIRIKK